MAAPSGTVWGAIVGSYGRIGIYKSVTSTATVSTVSIEVWGWSKYSISDSNYTLLFDILNSTGSATTERSGNNFSTSVSSGSGWSESNQKLLWSKSWDINRTTSTQTRYLYAKMSGVERVGGTMSASTTASIPALASYTVKYNANGGSGAPSSQTKWYGTALKLSTTKPTRTGYTFKGWATSASGSVAYAAGASYTSNAAVTLYAVWQANTYTVSFNANGGTGAPSAITKTYGVNATIPTGKPTKANYTFKGWGTSATTTTVAYSPGGAYTANAAATLYAVWELAYTKPKINGLTVDRCDSSGTVIDIETATAETTSGLLKFNWSTFQNVTSIAATWVSASGTVTGTKSITASGKSGSVSVVFGDGNLPIDQSFAVEVTINDGTSAVTYAITLDGYVFAIDFLAGGKGAAIGKPAEEEGVLDIAFRLKAEYGEIISSPIELPENTDLNELLTPGYYTISNTTISATIQNKPLWYASKTSTACIVVLPGGDTGQIIQRYYVCDKVEQFVLQRIYYQSALSDWNINSGCTTWKNLTFASGFTNHSSGAGNTPRYRVNGNIVSVTGVASPSEEMTSSSTEVVFATGIPSQFCPPINQTYLCQGTGANKWLLSIKTNGSLCVSRYGTTTQNGVMAANTWLTFSVSYSI